MTTDHLSLEQLLALREPGSEPGIAAARAHLDTCPACAEELHRLEQRVARLRALPTLRPGRDGWVAVGSRLAAERRGRRVRVAAGGGLALAASLLLAVVGRGAFQAAEPESGTELSAVMAQSQLLEEALRTWSPESRVSDGYTARVAGELESRIAQLDQQIETQQLTPGPARRQGQMLGLWRERVGLLDALVDVHLAGASDVGL